MPKENETFPERRAWIDALRELWFKQTGRPTSVARRALGPVRRIAVRVLDPSSRPRPVRFVRVYKAETRN